ncbi:MAG: hypothetical protein WCF36_09280 [Candidatus Nanopelagicales bacterium]
MPWEPLAPGPVGDRIAVRDWQPDGTRTVGVDLEDPYLLAQDGLAPDESDPQFRQQSVYAILSSLLETLDRIRGRHLVWANVWRDSPDGPGERPMPVFPHRLRAANAFYAPGEGLSFGSFTAIDDPLGLFPGQWVHGCLSQDIVNHEAGHAFLHELRPLSLEPTGVDAAAFHEGFADILAILAHFDLPGLLESQVAQAGARIWEPGPFVALAGEFGRGSGRREAVRRVLAEADPIPVGASTEPHERGAVLVAAVFEAFFAAYTQRVTPLLRAAGLSGAEDSVVLPQPLVDLVCREARAAAAMVLAMVVRAVDYLPPADITFSSFLDAVIAADSDLYPQDRDGFRRTLVEAARRRGIYPSELPGGRVGPRPTYADVELLPTRQALLMATHDLTCSAQPRSNGSRSRAQLGRSWRTDLLAWGRSNAELLGLDAEQVEVDGGNASFRIDQEGFPTAIVTARFTQRNHRAEADLPDALAGLPLIGGATVIAAASGQLRHVVLAPVPGIRPAGALRLEQMLAEAPTAGVAALDCLVPPKASGPQETSGPQEVPRPSGRQAPVPRPRTGGRTASPDRNTVG